MNAQEKITKARAGLILDAPFFGSIVLRLPMRENPEIETVSTNGKEIAYNPEFISGLSLEHLKGVLAHEVMHIAACHHVRRQERSPKKWNIAADYAINDVLTSAKFSLPKGALTGMGTDKSAEEIYAQIPDPPEGENGNDPGQCGEVTDAPGNDGSSPSPAELAQAEAETKVMVAQAAQQARAMGQLPAGIERLVAKILEPKVDWRDILRQFIQSNAKNDYAWMPPNKRFIHQGLYLPSLRSEELPPVVVAVDTSGSINQGDLDQFSAEISSVLEEYNTTVNVLYCDSEIAGHETFTRQDFPITLHAHGGGGTDFRPPFRWVSKQNETPSCMIYLTDLDCSRYPTAPEYPVLWAQIGNGGTKPPFGEVVKL